MGCDAYEARLGFILKQGCPEGTKWQGLPRIEKAVTGKGRRGQLVERKGATEEIPEVNNAGLGGGGLTHG